MKKICALCLTIAILSTIATLAYAAEPEKNVVDLGDGFYMVETITQYSIHRANDTVSANKTGSVFHGSSLVGTATLTAIFDISGSTSYAIKAAIGGTVRAYRHRRVVERRQQIGPNIIDFCGGLFQRADHILDVLAVKLEEAVSDRLRGNVAAADPYGGGGAAYRVQHQLQKVVYVIVGVLPPQTLVVNIRFQFFSSLVSIYLQSRRWGLSGGDGWIRLDKFCLVSFIAIQ